MSNIAHTEELAHGFTVEIHYDTDCGNSPRDWDTFGTMVGFSRDRSIGDEQMRDKGRWLWELALELPADAWPALWLYRQPNESVDEVDAMDVDDLGDRIESNPRKILAQIEQHCLILGFNESDRDGSIWETSAQSSASHSGFGGFIFVTHSDIAKEYGEVTPETLDKARKLLVGEIEEYSDWASGNVYGYVIKGPPELDEDGDEIDEGEELESVWGFIGDYDDYCLPEAIRAAQGHIDDWVKTRPHIPLPRNLALEVACPTSHA